MIQADIAERNAHILALNREGVSLRAIGERYGVSGERVRQIITRAGQAVNRQVNGKRGRPVAALKPEGRQRAAGDGSLAYDGERRAAVIALSRAYLAGQVLGVRP